MSEQETRRVEITEEGGVKLGRLDLAKDDIKTLPKELADFVISEGWGKDPDTGEQGERRAGSVRIESDSVVQKIAEL